MSHLKDKRREIIERGVQAILGDHKIPLKVHLKAIQDLKDQLRKSERTSKEVEDFLQEAKSVIQSYQAEVRRLAKIAKGDKGDPGDEGKPGEDADVRLIAAEISKSLPKASDLLNQVMEKLKNTQGGKVQKLDEDKLFEGFLKRIKKDKSLVIEDLKDGQGFIFNSTRYKFSDLMRGAGGGSSAGTNVITEQVTGTQAGDDVTIDLAQLSHTFDTILFVTRNGQVIMPNGSSFLPGSSWSISGDIVTVYNAAAEDIFLVQYTYA